MQATIAAGVISVQGVEKRAPIIAALTDAMAQRGVPLIRWNATTPETLPPVKVDTVMFNTVRELSCLHSHVALIKHIHDSGADFGLVFEDDAILHPAFDLGSLIGSAPADWEVLTLGTNNPDYFRLYDLMKQHGGPNWLRWNIHYWGTHAYIIRASIMQRIATRFIDPDGAFNLTGQFNPFHFVADNILYCDAKTYISRFPWACQDSSVDSLINVQKKPGPNSVGVDRAALGQSSHSLIQAIWAA